MNVELVHDENPLGVFIQINGSTDMRHKISFGTGWTDRRRHQLPGRHTEVSNQAHRAMANVFKLSFFNLPWLCGLGFMFALQCLNRGQFIATNQMDAVLMELYGLVI